jgi:hypothetical protein
MYFTIEVSRISTSDYVRRHDLTMLVLDSTTRLRNLSEGLKAVTLTRNF